MYKSNFWRKLQRNCKQTNNQKIREENNISTIESKLKYYRLNTYYRIRETHSISYLNDKEYINNELRTIDAPVSLIKNNINNRNNDSLNGILQYKTLSLIGKEHMEENT